MRRLCLWLMLLMLTVGLCIAEGDILPKLSVKTPPKLSTTTKKTIIVKGEASDASKVTINGKQLQLKANGVFFSEVNLHKGVNNIEVHAENNVGSKNIILSVTRVGREKSKVKDIKRVPASGVGQVSSVSPNSQLSNASATTDLKTTTLNMSTKTKKTKLAYSLVYPELVNGVLRTTGEQILFKFRVWKADTAIFNGKVLPIKKGMITRKETLHHLGDNSFSLLISNRKEKLETVVHVQRVAKPVASQPQPDTLSATADPIIQAEMDNNENSEVKAETSKATEKIKTTVTVPVKSRKKSKIAITKLGGTKKEKQQTKTILKKVKVNGSKETDRPAAITAVKDVSKSSIIQRLPLTSLKDQVSLTHRNLPDVSLQLKGADVKDVIDILSRKSGLNIIADESLTGKVSLNLNKVPFTTAFDLILQTYGYAYTRIGNTIIVGARDKISSPASLETRVFKLYHANAESVNKVLEPYLSKEEKTSVAKDENSIIVYASTYTIDRIAGTIANLDRTIPRQVFIEAKVIEIGTNDLKNHGVDWGGKASVIQETVVDSTGGNKKVMSLVMPEIGLNYLTQAGSSKVLASPRMAAIDGQKASILVGDRYPYTITQLDPKSGLFTSEVKFVESGVKLSIIPYINSESGSVELEIKTEVSFIYSFVGPNNSIPWVRTREATTKVRLKNGQTAVIGGLLNSEDKDAKFNIPILSDIPLIGGLFSTRKKENSDTELLLTVTPRILEN